MARPRLDPSVRERIVEGVFAHVTHHSTYLPAPQGYEFDLGDGFYLPIHDVMLGKRRTLMFYRRMPISHTREIHQMYARLRREDQLTPWFHGYTDKQLRRVMATLRRAVDRSYGEENVRDRGIPLLDPLSEPTEMPGFGVAPRRADGPQVG